MHLKEEKLFNLLSTPIKKKGYNLLDIRFFNVGDDRKIQLIIYKTNGIEIEDCVKVNEITSELLKNNGFILDNSTLEISSPGIYMNLNKPEHFRMFKGKRVKVKLLQEIQGIKKATGNIIECTKKGITLKMEKSIEFLNIPFSYISKANLEPKINI